MNIVELHPRPDFENLAPTLRRIADDIEAGRMEFTPTLAVLVLATETANGSGTEEGVDWATFGLGRDATTFTVRGILASALNKLGGPEDEA